MINCSMTLGRTFAVAGKLTAVVLEEVVLGVVVGILGNKRVAGKVGTREGEDVESAEEGSDS